MSNRIFVIGLDGATFDLILPWIQENRLPTLAKLMKSGVYASLRSTIPMFTATAWSSFATGLNPGKHGVTGFIIRNNVNKPEVVTSLHRHGRTIWSILSDYGRKVIVVNVPLTYPPQKVNGILISGMLTPPGAEDYTYPPEIKDELKSVVGNYQVHPRIIYEEGKEREFIAAVSETTNIQAKAMLYLMEKYPWDFSMIVFNGPDQLQHALWKYLDPFHPDYDAKNAKEYVNSLLNYYKLLDALIALFIKKAGSNTSTIVMSDHGFGPLYKFIHVNQWLIKNGLLRFKPTPLTLIRWLLYQLNVTPERLYNVLLKVHFGNIRSIIGRHKGHKLLSRFFLSFEDVDWNNTVAFSLGAMGQIYININEKENQKKNSEILEQIVNLLYKLKDPDTGESVIEKVYRKREVYCGRFLDRMPDVLFVPKSGYIAFEEYEFASNKIFTKPRGISGTHRLNGILIITGPHIKQKGCLKNFVKIEDLAPTILYMFGLPIPLNMDGSLIAEAFDDEFLKMYRVKFRKMTESERIKEKIRSLSKILANEKNNANSLN